MMLRSLARVSRTSPSAVSAFLKSECYNPLSAHGVHLRRTYDTILEPCLSSQSHYTRTSQGNVQTVKIPYHDYLEMDIPDYFSALGYFLSHHGAPDTILDFTQLIQLLTQYAEWCRVSSAILKVNTPTVVQLLWVASPRFRYPPAPGHPHVASSSSFESFDGRFALASSVTAGQSEGRSDVRESRIKTLEAVWPHPLTNPTPVQREHANSDSIKVVRPTAELFGTPWGHCGESISFASMYKMILSGVPLGTLALSVKAMTSPIPGTSTIPVEVIPNLHHLNDIIEVLRTSGAMRPMCLNCQYLSSVVSARIDDYAHRLSGQMSVCQGT